MKKLTSVFLAILLMLKPICANNWARLGLPEAKYKSMFIPCHCLR